MNVPPNNQFLVYIYQKNLLEFNQNAPNAQKVIKTRNFFNNLTDSELIFMENDKKT